MKDRRFNKRFCVKCARISWTSVKLSKPYVCASCKRAAGETGTGKRGEGHYSSMSVHPVPVVSFGFCPCCGRADQKLINGQCEDGIFYSDRNDVDAVTSARARRGKGGVNDWVRKVRP